MDWFEAALVEGYVFAYEAAEAVDDCGVGDCFGGVDVSVYFWTGATEVEDGFALFRIDTDFETDWGTVVHEFFCAEVLAFEAFVYFFQELTNGLLGVLLNVGHVELYDLLTVVGH